MKELMLITLMSITSAQAGIGGISGGHINFQRESTWVHPLYSKSLCFDGVDFHAKIKKCAKVRNGDSGGCERFENVDAVQPKESTKMRCSKTGGDDNCRQWEEVPYIQYPNRVLDLYVNDHQVKTVKFRVKNCQ